MNNTLAIIIAFYLSKYNKDGLNNLGFTSFNESFEITAKCLGVKKNYVKLRRDEFDYIFPWRKGWQRPMTKRIERTIYILNDLEEADIREIVENILYNPDYRKSDELLEITQIINSPQNDNSKSNKNSKFIVRCPTGRAAEDFFTIQYNEQKLNLPIGCLVDCRDMGCGYDYKIIDNNNTEYYVEVKGMYDDSGGILFTNKEWKTAEEKNSNFFLCIVRNIGKKPEIELINNPFNMLSPTKNIRPSIQISWSVTKSELLATQNKDIQDAK